jgi:hypothetical protein
MQLVLNQFVSKIEGKVQLTNDKNEWGETTLVRREDIQVDTYTASKKDTIIYKKVRRNSASRTAAASISSEESSRAY